MCSRIHLLIVIGMMMTVIKASAQAQPGLHPIANRPGVVAYGDSIHVADSLARLAFTSPLRKVEALRNSDGLSRVWVDPVNGDDSSDGNGYFNAVETLTRASQLLPHNGNLSETPSLLLCPGAYPDAFGWSISGTGTVTIDIIDSLEFDAYMRSSTKSSWWGAPTVVLQDALARGIDTSGWNPFIQSPAYIESYFRLADINRVLNVYFLTHYHIGGDWDGWATPAGRLHFRGAGWLILECNWIYNQRSHITFDMTTTTEAWVCGLWINGGVFGGMAFLQDSAKGDATTPAAMQLTSQMYMTYNDIPMINTPGGSKHYYKNVRRVANFTNSWNWRANFFPSMFWRHGYNANYTANWKYENALRTKGELWLDEKYSGVVFYDSTKLTLTSNSSGIVISSPTRGNSISTTEAIPANVSTTNLNAARMSVRTPSVRKYSGNFGGNVWIHYDSTLYGGHAELRSVRDTTSALNPSGQGIAGIATVGAGDSVRVNITGVLPTDVFALSYSGGTAAAVKHPWSNVFVANTLTIYGDAGRKISYIRIRK